MILEFSVQNYRSIKEMQTLSFVASGLRSNAEKHPQVDACNLVDQDGHRVLKTVGIYGSNASGKSNVLKALTAFANAVTHLPSPESRLGELADPFLYQHDAAATESYFQVIFTFKGQKYRYGFTIGQQTTDNGVMGVVGSEWLYGPKGKNQGKLFIRRGLKVEKDAQLSDLAIPPLQYEHTLFLTHAASFSKGICASIREYLSTMILTNYRKSNDGFREATLKHFVEDPSRKQVLLRFLSSFQLPYMDIKLDREPSESLQNFPMEKIHLMKLNGHWLNLAHQESAGTQKLFDLAGYLLRAFNWRSDGLIVLDEIDSNFHPYLLVRLIRHFNDPKVNRSNFQLLFTSHDTNLMDPALMRRDQFYFTEKDAHDATRLFSLSDLKGIRNDADFARQYLAGFYGGVPIFEEFKMEEQAQP